MARGGDVIFTRMSLNDELTRVLERIGQRLDLIDSKLESLTAQRRKSMEWSSPFFASTICSAE